MTLAVISKDTNRPGPFPALVVSKRLVRTLDIAQSHTCCCFLLAMVKMCFRVAPLPTAAFDLKGPPHDHPVAPAPPSPTGTSATSVLISSRRQALLSPRPTILTIYRASLGLADCYSSRLATVFSLGFLLLGVRSNDLNKLTRP